MKKKLPTLRRRPSRTLPTLILAFIMVILGAFTLWALIFRVAEHRWPPQVSAHVAVVLATPIGSIAAIALGIVIAALGVILLLIGIIPGRYSRAAISSQSEIPGETMLSLRDIGRYVRARLLRVDGVGSAKVKVRAKKLKAWVTTPYEDTSAVSARVEKAVAHALVSLEVADVPTVTVDVTRKNG